MSDDVKPKQDVTELVDGASAIAPSESRTSLPAGVGHKPGTTLADDLDALSALCEAATPGPWRNDHTELHASNLHPSWRMTWSGDGSGFGEVTRSHDAAFIAAARTAMPALIERVRAAERERDEATVERREVWDALNCSIANASALRKERDELRAAVERVREVIERVANDALLYGWADGQGRTDKPILFTVWAKERAEREVQALHDALNPQTEVSK